MTEQLLNEIFDDRKAKSSEPLTRDKFDYFLCLNINGKERVLEVWDEAHETVNWPNEDISLYHYYRNLFQNDIITGYQLDKLLQDLP